MQAPSDALPHKLLSVEERVTKQERTEKAVHL